MGGGAQTTAGMLRCANEEFGRQEERLDRAYGLVDGRLDHDAQLRLRAEEDAWKQSLDDACVLGDDAGTKEQVSQADCIVRETALRAEVLEGRATR